MKQNKAKLIMSTIAFRGDKWGEQTVICKIANSCINCRVTHKSVESSRRWSFIKL